MSQTIYSVFPRRLSNLIFHLFILPFASHSPGKCVCEGKRKGDDNQVDEECGSENSCREN